MNFFLALVTLLTSASALGDQLAELDHFLGSGTIQEEFANVRSYERSEISCIGTTSICDKQRRLSRSLIASSEGVEIQSISPNGTVHRSETLAADRWKSMAGNWVRFHIALSEGFGFQLESLEVTDRTFSVVIEGATVELVTKVASLTFRNLTGQTVRKEIAQTNDLKGLGRLVYLKETNLSGITTTSLQQVN